jgi:hypothetical protein
MTELPLRKFGLTFAAVFAALAAWFHAASWAPLVLAVLAAVMLIVALTRPSLLAVPTRLWLALGAVMHRVTSPVVLAAMYVFLIVPSGLLRRWLGGDPLKRRFDSTLASYWTPCATRSRKLDDFRQQF